MKTTEDQLFEDVRRRLQKIPDLHISLSPKQAYRIATSTPQAIMKVISFAKDKSAVGKMLDYISRKGDIELEDPQGFTLDKEEANKRLDEWSKDFQPDKKVSREALHIMFSSPTGSDIEKVKVAVKNTLEHEFEGNQDFLFAPHLDTQNPHIHVIIKIMGFNGRKLNPKKADLRRWRKTYAKSMRKVGIQVDSSSRLERGMGFDLINNSDYHAVKRGDTPVRLQKKLEKAKHEASRGILPVLTAAASRAKIKSSHIRIQMIEIAKAMFATNSPEMWEKADVINDYALERDPLQTAEESLFKRFSQPINQKQSPDIAP